MRGCNYFLALNTSKGLFISKPGVTLREIDLRTIKYNNKDELIDTIIDKAHLDISKKDISEVIILMKTKDGYKKEDGPFYKDNEKIIDTSFVIDRFNVYSMNSNFISYFIKYYDKINNFKESISEIDYNIKNGYSYDNALRSLSSKLFSTYKGSRRVYSIMNNYKNKFKFSKALYEQYKEMYTSSIVEGYSDDEMTLKYLIEHDRELLDIEDFIHHESISPFDGSKNERCR